MEKDREVAEYDPFKAMDAMDDAAIIAEIQGRITEAWVYGFMKEGRRVWGLSKIGVDMACREMAKKREVIKELSCDMQPDPTDDRFVLFKASAQRIYLGEKGEELPLEPVFGFKRQCIFITTRSGISSNTNPFYYEQGSIKALRNARQRLISEEVRAQIITKAKETGRVSDVGDDEDNQETTAHHEQLREMIMDHVEQHVGKPDKAEAVRILQSLTEFTDKSGRKYSGNTSIDSLSAKQATIALAKFKKLYADIKMPEPTKGTDADFVPFPDDRPEGDAE